MSNEVEFSQLGIRTSIEGKLTLADQTSVRGSIKGELSAPIPSRVIFETCSTFEGTARVDEIILHGFFEGELRSVSQVTLGPTARFKGTIECKSIKIEDGALLEGSVKTIESKR